jgi:putative FmdB family regulatory protein
MPIFEYQCQSCEHIFEKVLLGRNRDAAPACPSCQATQTRQLVSRFSSLSADVGGFTCAPSAFS